MGALMAIDFTRRLYASGERRMHASPTTWNARIVNIVIPAKTGIQCLSV
jgi:hypothetical protein